MLRSALQRGLRVASSSFTVLHPVSRIDAVQRCQVATTVGGATSPSPRRLDEVLKLDDLEGKSAAEIASIWTEARALFTRLCAIALLQPSLVAVQYHKDPGKGRIADVLPAEDYSDFAEKAAKSPMFVLPMARGPSQLQNLLLQMQLPHAFFTTLDEYKVCVAICLAAIDSHASRHMFP